jgi:hypothetical protein
VHSASLGTERRVVPARSKHFHMLRGLVSSRTANLLITNSTLRLPSGELHTNFAELHTPCTLYHVHGNKIYHMIKIRIIAISGGSFLDAARWKLLDVCGERETKLLG